MASGEEYRVKATELFGRAACEANAAVRSQLESIALAYLRLAAQAERNSRTDIVYQTPPPRPIAGDREC